MSFALLASNSHRRTNHLQREERTMRKAIAALFVSLDGVVGSPEKWHLPYFNEEMGAAIGESMAESDALLMGRVNYEEWAEYWPNQSSDESGFADYMNNTPKYVVSTTLNDVEWNNSKLLGGDLSEVAKLKQEPGADITINGSPTLVRSLIREGLLDELRLMIHPVVVGEGKRLFEDGERGAFELADSRTFDTGVVYAIYKPVAS
jgi:dihydrofolate reductase